MEGGRVCESCRRPFLPSDSWSLRFFFGQMDRNRDDCVGTGGTVHRKAHRREVSWTRPGKGPSGKTFPRPAPCRERRTWPACRRLGCSLGPSLLRGCWRTGPVMKPRCSCGPLPRKGVSVVLGLIFPGGVMKAPESLQSPAGTLARGAEEDSVLLGNQSSRTPSLFYSGWEELGPRDPLSHKP